MGRISKNKRCSSVGLIPFIVLSALFHLLLFFLKVDLISDHDPDSLVNIQYYDLSEHVQDEKKIEKPPVPEKEKELRPEGQIVDIAKPDVEKKPESKKFLSQYDSSVDKEKKSDFDTNIEQRGKKLQKSLAMDAKPKELTSEDSVIEGDPDKPLHKDMEKMKKGKLEGFDGTDGSYAKGEERSESGVIDGKDEKYEEGSQYVGGRSIPKRFLPYMSGNDSNLMSPSSDYLKDVEKSEETALNTHRYIYSAYFNKIKQAVARHWTPAYAYIINDPSGHIYGRRNRFTRIIAVINSNGTLASIKLETSSGLDFLDREAINAFKMAAPFRNPPEPLLSEEGTLEIRFGFMFEME